MSRSAEIMRLLCYEDSATAEISAWEEVMRPCTGFLQLYKGSGLAGFANPLRLRPTLVAVTVWLHCGMHYERVLRRANAECTPPVPGDMPPVDRTDSRFGFFPLPRDEPGKDPSVSVEVFYAARGGEVLGVDGRWVVKLVSNTAANHQLLFCAQSKADAKAWELQLRIRLAPLAVARSHQMGMVDNGSSGGVSGMGAARDGPDEASKKSVVAALHGGARQVLGNDVLAGIAGVVAELAKPNVHNSAGPVVGVPFGALGFALSVFVAARMVFGAAPGLSEELHLLYSKLWRHVIPGLNQLPHVAVRDLIDELGLLVSDVEVLAGELYHLVRSRRQRLWMAYMAAQQGLDVSAEFQKRLSRWQQCADDLIRLIHVGLQRQSMAKPDERVRFVVNARPTELKTRVLALPFYVHDEAKYSEMPAAVDKRRFARARESTRRSLRLSRGYMTEEMRLKKEAEQATADENLLRVMVDEEKREWEALGATSLSDSARDQALRFFACTATANGLWKLHGSAPPSPKSPNLTSVRNLTSVPLLDLFNAALEDISWPGAQMHVAFAACASAYAGADLSPAWLRFHFGDGANFHSVNLVNVGGGVTSMTFVRGKTLYVATVEERPKAWSSWLAFFASSMIEVSESCLRRALAKPLVGVPGTFALLSCVWDSVHAQTGVQDDIWRAVDTIRKCGVSVTDVVFCGHGFGGAVARLLALFFALQPQPIGNTVASSVVTFGCPSIGDAAFEEYLVRRTRHTRLYVEHDPIAGLPRSTCVGLRFSPGVERFAETLAHEHWVLSEDCQPTAGSSASPRVLSLSVAGLAHESYHNFLAYAVCLPRPYLQLFSPELAWPFDGSHSGAPCDAGSGGDGVESESAPYGGEVQPAV